MSSTEWFDARVAEARAEVAGLPAPPDVAAMGREEALDWAGTLPKCEKGCCIAPASRFASYYSTYDGLRRAVAHMPSCDRHGTDPLTPYPHADALRAAEARLREAGLAWWLD